MDPGKHVPAEIRYEMRIINGPYRFAIRGEKIVGVIGLSKELA